MPERPLPDWSGLSFAFTETDVVYLAHGDLAHKPIWDRGEFRPFGNIEFSPAAAFLSYGLGVFEGLKAQRTRDDRVLLFRHGANAERFRRSAERLLMAPFPAEQFMEAVEETTRRNLRFVPPFGKGSLYLRPMQWGLEPKLGLGPTTRFMVTIYGSPVGDYFSKKKTAGPGGVRLKALEQGRVAPGGTGAAKAMGNYAGGISIAHTWKERGFDDVLYLDARHLKHVTETSGSNVFVKLRGGPLLTPPLDDQILPGITRESVIRIAREVVGIQVEERPIEIDEALSKAEEIFCTGTAWTVQSVREVVHHDRAWQFPGSALQKQLLEAVRGIQTGEKEDPFGWTKEVTAEPAGTRR
jgi:branched-chain amino acid aminotransferase